MSVDNQFTATGASGQPTFAGFFTNANNITYGVNVQGLDTTGNGCGVYAECMKHSPLLRSSRAGSLPGVWGVGDHYGVYGASNKLYSLAPAKDNTPVLSPDAISGIDSNAPGAMGGIGVAGASLNVPGVIGTSDLTIAFNGIFMNDIIPHTAGVMGLSGTSAGVMGFNVSVPKDTNLPQQLKSLLAPNDPQSNAGVFGWSMNGRGGIFGSATPVVPGFPDPAPNQGLAQIRLLPTPVTAIATPAGVQTSLPLLGQAGDLIAVVVAAPFGAVASTELWFCIASGGGPTTPASWAQITFGRIVSGSH